MFDEFIDIFSIIWLAHSVQNANGQNMNCSNTSVTC